MYWIAGHTSGSSRNNCLRFAETCTQPEGVGVPVASARRLYISRSSHLRSRPSMAF